MIDFEYRGWGFKFLEQSPLDRMCNHFRVFVWKGTSSHVHELIFLYEYFEFDEIKSWLDEAVSAVSNCYCWQ